MGLAYSQKLGAPAKKSRNHVGDYLVSVEAWPLFRPCEGAQLQVGSMEMDMPCC